jgi:hypothetical protein
VSRCLAMDVSAVLLWLHTSAVQASCHTSKRHIDPSHCFMFQFTITHLAHHNNIHSAHTHHTDQQWKMESSSVPRYATRLLPFWTILIHWFKYNFM